MDTSQYSAEEIAALAEDDRRPNVIAALVCGCVISAVTVGLRYYVRIVKLRIFGADDFFMMVAQIFCIGMAVTLGLEVEGGLGRHMLNLTDDEMILYFKSFYASIWVYNVGMTVVKVSILLQYRRIFQSAWFQRAALALLAFIVFWTVGVMIWVGVLCIPVELFWNPQAEGRCLSLLPAFYVPAAMNIATDFAVLALPIPVLKTISLPRKQKYVLYGIFGIGFLTCIISIIRLYTLEQAASDADSTWATVDAAIWSHVEISMSIAVGSLPTLRPLISRFLPASLNASSLSRPSHPSLTPLSGGGGGGGGDYHLRYLRDNNLSSLTSPSGQGGKVSRLQHQLSPASSSFSSIPATEKGERGIELGGGAEDPFYYRSRNQ